MSNRSRRGLLLALGASLIAGAAATIRADVGPKKVALLVGVNRYRTRILADRPLEYAERDVEDLAAVLKAQGFDVRTLAGDAATKEAIDAALSAALKGREAADLVVLGFAGHGVQMPLVDARGDRVADASGRPLGDAYFCPVNAVFGDGNSMVSLTRLFERLDREGGINLILVDACRDNPDPDRGLRSLSGDELNGRLPKNSVILFSCSAGQRSLETPKAGGGHGVFFHHVIEGLKGRAADPETHEVSWDNLVAYVRKHVNPRAREWLPELAAEADRRTPGHLQDPHQISNLVATPVLARLLPDRGGVPFADSIGIKVVPIPEGSFLMGSPDSDTAAEADEKPRHRVRIARLEGMSAREVTVGQFRRFVDDTGHRTDAESSWKEPGFDQAEDHPVVKVSWDDAVAFCRWLSSKDGREFRLPTEAEWEYACRAGTDTRYSYGDDPEGIARVGNIAGDRDGYKFTAPVGRFRPNAWGLFDMHGNVWEWCLDGYDPGYYRTPAASSADPPGPPGASARVLRGGSWFNVPLNGRAAYRFSYAQGDRSLSLGFRPASVRPVP